METSVNFAAILRARIVTRPTASIAFQDTTSTPLAVVFLAPQPILLGASSVMPLNASTARLDSICQAETAHHVLMLTARYATTLSQPNAFTVTVVTLSTVVSFASSATHQCLAATNAHRQTCVRPVIMGIICYQEELVVRYVASLCRSVGRA
jgi:hypothetical protein